MRPVSRRVPGAHGLSLHLLEWSAGGDPLLLLHGFGHSARVWDEVVPGLRERHRVLALDARGHGDSQHDPEYRYHHAAVTKDVEAVAEHLGLERLALVGHSMGGYAAIRFAARHPERVTRLALVDAGPQLSAGAGLGRAEAPEPSYASVEEYAEALRRAYPRARGETLARLAPHWLRRRGDGRFEQRLDPAFLRKPRPEDPANRRSFDRARWARDETQRLWACLERIHCPTLVLRGEHSSQLSAKTLAGMLEVLADARAAAIPGAGHAVMLDAPDALRAELGTFFTS